MVFDGRYTDRNKHNDTYQFIPNNLVDWWTGTCENSRNWFEPIKGLQLSRKVDQGVNDDDFWLDASKMHSKYSFQLRYWNWSRKGFKYFEWIIAAHFAAKVKKNISKYFITNLSRFQICRLKSISIKLKYQKKFSAMEELVVTNSTYSLLCTDVSLWLSGEFLYPVLYLLLGSF